MSVKMTYAEVRRAFLALNTLIGGGLKDGNGAYAPELPFRTVLKIKRIVGVLTPLVEALNELEREIAGKFPDWNGQFNATPKDAAPLFNELYAVECTVGADILSENDFSSLKTVPVTFAGVLADLGALFNDEESPAAAPVVVEPEPVA